MKKLVLTIGVLVSSLGALASSTTGSWRQDLQLTGAMVNMSDARAIKIDGLKASYAYSFAMKDMTKTHPGSSSYNLVLGAQDGKLMSMFTLSYNGVAQEPAFATSGQIMGHLGRHCLGLSEEALKTVGTDFGALVNASINAKGAAQGVSKSLGSVVVIWQNVQFTEKNFRFVLYVSNTAKPGTTGRKTTCLAKV